MENLFISKNQISNLDKIMSIALYDAFCENIEDVISIIEKYDKKRDRQSNELKNVLFTVVREMLDHTNVFPIFICSYNEQIRKNPLTNTLEIIEYLNENWYKYDEIGRAYLLFFERVEIKRVIY